MRRDDVDAFLTELGKLAETLGVECSEARALLYFEALADLPLESVVTGLTTARQQVRLSLLPTPGEIRRFIEGSPDDQAALAWQRVWQAFKTVGTYESVDFGDPAIHGVLDQMGGWAQAWRWERLPERDLGFVRRDFCQLYRLWPRGRMTMRYLPGQAELQNAATRPTWTRGEIPELVVHRLAPDGTVERRALVGQQRPEEADDG